MEEIAKAMLMCFIAALPACCATDLLRDREQALTMLQVQYCLLVARPSLQNLNTTHFAWSVVLSCFYVVLSPLRSATGHRVQEAHMSCGCCELQPQSLQRLARHGLGTRNSKGTGSSNSQTVFQIVLWSVRSICTAEGSIGFPTDS